jgi:hypothetical protein
VKEVSKNHARREPKTGYAETGKRRAGRSGAEGPACLRAAPRAPAGHATRPWACRAARSSSPLPERCCRSARARLEPISACVDGRRRPGCASSSHRPRSSPRVGLLRQRCQRTDGQEVTDLRVHRGHVDGCTRRRRVVRALFGSETPSKIDRAQLLVARCRGFSRRTHHQLSTQYTSSDNWRETATPVVWP